MRPAKYASRPASQAYFIAYAIGNGCWAWAMAVLSKTPSQPSSMAQYFGIAEDLVRAKTRKREVVQARQVAMYFVTRLCDCPLQATADYFGLTSYGGVSWACAQIREKQAKEETFRISLERMENHILQQQT